MDLVDITKKYMEENSHSLDSFGRLIDVSKSVLSRWLNRKLDNSSKVDKKVKDFFERNEVREDSFSETDILFAETKISRDIIGVLNYCRSQRLIAIIHGDAGIGKTRTMREWVKNKTDCIILTITPVTNNVKSLLKILATELGVRRSGTNDDIYIEVLTKLQGTDKIILVDEAQHLGYKALEILRSLNDATQTAICLIGNEIIYQKMMGRQRAEFAQLFSRVGMKKNLLTDDFSMKDVRNIFMDTDDETSKYLLKIVRSKFGLRGAIHTYVNAKNNEDISLRGIKAMSNFMGQVI